VPRGAEAAGGAVAVWGDCCVGARGNAVAPAGTVKGAGFGGLMMIG